MATSGGRGGGLKAVQLGQVHTALYFSIIEYIDVELVAHVAVP